MSHCTTTQVLVNSQIHVTKNVSFSLLLVRFRILVEIHPLKVSWIAFVTFFSQVKKTILGLCCCIIQLFQITRIIIQQIVTLSKYGHDALDICHP